MNYKYLLLLLSAFYFGNDVTAQEQPIHKKKVYLDKNQRLYVQDSLPVYMFLSTHPDGKDAVQLKSEKTPQYVNPMHFDGHGKHNITHKDYEHEVEITFEVYSDANAPETHFSLNKATIYNKDNKVYCAKGIEVAFTAADDMSGLEDIYYSVNGSNYEIFSKNFIPEKEQEYTIKFYSVDNVGNAEKVHTKSFMVDNTAPVTELTVHGDLKENIISAHSTIHLKAEDTMSGVSKIIYQLDGGHEMLYTSPISVASLSEGEHTVYYHSVDHLLNKENVKEYKFFIDKSAPMVIEDVIGDKFVVNGKEFSSGRTKVKLTAIDNKSGVKAIYYSVNGGPYQEYIEPFDVPRKGGSVSIKSYAIDFVSNKSLNAEEGNGGRFKSSYVDLSGPDLNYTFQGPVFKTRDTFFISAKTHIYLKASDIEAGLNKITYSIDKKGDNVYKENFTISEEGAHTVEFSGYDNVNNSNSNSFYFHVDNSGPEINVHFSILPIGNTNNNDVYPSHVVLFPSATDDLVGYDKMYYSVNGAPEKQYSGMIDGFHKNETYSVAIRALDKLGNETKKEISFKTEAQKLTSADKTAAETKGTK